LKKTRQYSINKYLSKVVKLTTPHALKCFEFSLYNILVRSKLFLTFEESIYMIENGCIYVNSTIINKPNHKLRLYDKISVGISKNIFNFTKINFNAKLKLTFSLGYRI
jgi:ribosomal protein S4